MCHLTPLILSKIESRVAMSPEVDLSAVIAEVVLSVVFLLLMLFFRKRFLRILCACISETMLFLACIAFFGDSSIITWIMRWITAAAACVLTVAIVNRINWKQKQASSPEGSK